MNGIGGVVLSALGIGTIEVTALVNGEPVYGELHEVLHVPGIGSSLFSIGCATAAGMNVLFSETKVVYLGLTETDRASVCQSKHSNCWSKNW